MVERLPRTFFPFHSGQKLENFYFIQMYKLATCSHPDGPAMDVMGTFFKLSPWPSFWWNLNIQLTYMPIGPANRMEQGKNFQRLMDEVFPSLVRSIEPCKIGDYTWALQTIICTCDMPVLTGKISNNK